jgi:hypothetical protein
MAALTGRTAAVAWYGEGPVRAVLRRAESVRTVPARCGAEIGRFEPKVTNAAPSSNGHVACKADDQIVDVRCAKIM